jgi:hypothetical protein
MIVAYNHFWKYSADYVDFANEFNLVKNYIAEEFPNETDKLLTVSNNGRESVSLFDPETKTYLVLPAEISASLKTIRNNAFPDKDSNFDTIRIQDERIAFCISNGEYALVFSPEKKPTWVNSPNEVSRVKLKAIQDGWYHVRKDK